MKHIIFIDVDGTIYGLDKIIHNQTIKDIKYAQSKGVEVVINTGNGPFSNMKNLATNLNIRYLINSNGASIYDFKENKAIFSKAINASAADEIIKMANKLELASDWWDNEKIYVNKFIPQSTVDLIKHAMSVDFDPVPVESVVNDPLKFEFYSSKDEVWKVDEILENVDKSKWNFARMQPRHVEVTQKGVSKGDGVIHFCKLFNVDLKNTGAVGDSANDHSMFEVVEHSYAMDNADKVTKSIVKHHTSDVKQNGVGEAIIDFMFRMGIDK